LTACLQDSNTNKQQEGLKNSELHRKANQFYKTNNLEKAILVYEEILRENAKDSVANYYMGQCYLKQLKYRKAIDFYNNAITLGPKFQYAYVSRGLANYKLNHLDASESDYLSALNLSPEDHRALNGLGNLYMSKKDYLKASENYETGCREKPDNYQYRYNLCTAYYYDKRYSDAEELLVDRLTQNPEDGRSGLLLSKTLLRLDKQSEACARLSSLIAQGEVASVDYSKSREIEIEVDLSNLTSFQEALDVLKSGIQAQEVVYHEAEQLKRKHCLTTGHTL